MPIDENGLSVCAVARDIRHIVCMADIAHPPAQRFQHVKEDEIVNVFVFVTQFSLHVHRGARDAEARQKMPRGAGHCEVWSGRFGLLIDGRLRISVRARRWPLLPPAFLEVRRRH
jgi:hypothetical protein